MAAPIFQRTVVDTQGNVVEGAVVEVRNEATDELAPIFVDRPLTDVKANPFTTDSTGFIRFFAAAGDYRIKATFGAEEIIFRFVQLIDTDELIDFDSSQTLLNKTIAFGSNTLTDVASINTTQTLTNKTLASPALTNPSYTGTLTGGTGVVNLGSGQLFKGTNGNVGIGTSSPAVRLQVNTSANATAGLIVKSFSVAGGVQPLANFQRLDAAINLQIGYNGDTGDSFFGTTTNHNLFFISNNTERMRISPEGNVGIGATGGSAFSAGRFMALNGASGKASSEVSVFEGSNNHRIEMFVNNTAGLVGLNTGSSSGSYGGISFQIENTERMRLDRSGNLLVGTTSNVSGSAAKLFVLGGAQTYAAQCGNGGNFFTFRNQSGTEIGFIFNNTTSTVYGTSSDYRLKHDIQPMTGALAKVALLKPCTYKWNADNSADEGFIAHELQEICPSAVTGEKDAVDAKGTPQYQGIDTSFVVPLLTAALQEAVAEIESLKARLDAANL